MQGEADPSAVQEHGQHQRPFRRPPNWGFVVALVLGLAGYAGLVRLDRLHGTLRDQITPQTIGWFSLAFASYIFLLFWMERRPLAMGWLWAGAILFRFLMLLTAPTLSDDVFRYMWDGHIANQGVSPYAYSVEAPELDPLDIPIRSRVNNPWMASPYLPAAQWVFGLLGAIAAPSAFYQGGMVLFDLLGALLIARLLALAALPSHRLTVYLWNPLVVLEVAHGAHVDALMSLLAVAAIWATWRFSQPIVGAAGTARKLVAPLSLALATLTKILPVLLLPVLYWRWSWGQRVFYGLAIIGILVPYALQSGWGLTGPMDGVGLFGAARIYADQWSFNSGFYASLEQQLEARGLSDPMDTARQIVVTALAVGVLAVAWNARKALGIRKNLRLAAIPFMAYLLFTTTVHPWYALSLLALLPFLAPGRQEPQALWLHVIPWIYLSGALITSYVTYLDPLNYKELAWVRRLEWYPTWGLLALALIYLRPRLFSTPSA